MANTKICVILKTASNNMINLESPCEWWPRGSAIVPRWPTLFFKSVKTSGSENLPTNLFLAKEADSSFAFGLVIYPFDFNHVTCFARTSGHYELQNKERKCKLLEWLRKMIHFFEGSLLSGYLEAHYRFWGKTFYESVIGAVGAPLESRIIRAGKCSVAQWVLFPAKREIKRWLGRPTQIGYQGRCGFY